MGWLDVLDERVRAQPEKSVLLDIGMHDIDRTILGGWNALPASVRACSVADTVPNGTLAAIEEAYQQNPSLPQFALRRTGDVQRNRAAERYAQTLTSFSGIILERSANSYFVVK
jgi:hypothetical protein